MRYIEVCPIEKTDPLFIVQSLLKYIVAEFFVCKDLETDFAETNITQRKLFNQFLTGNTIYRTDSSGKIANALISGGSVKPHRAPRPENARRCNLQTGKPQSGYLPARKGRPRTMRLY